MERDEENRDWGRRGHVLRLRHRFSRCLVQPKDLPVADHLQEENAGQIRAI